MTDDGVCEECGLFSMEECIKRAKFSYCACEEEGIE